MTGVIEIDELVNVLKMDNAENVFVCRMPKDMKYVDYMCICTGRSRRHMIALAEFVRLVFKKKRNRKDVIPKIEGANSEDWIAMDLGNIALHIFAAKTRAHFDLEQLWSVGHEFDALFNKKQDDYLDILERHSLFLRDLTPAKAQTPTEKVIDSVPDRKPSDLG